MTTIELESGQKHKTSGHRPDDHPDYLDMHEAAKALDVSPEALRKRITRGTIKAVKRGGHWYVQIADNHPDSVRTEVRSNQDDHVDGKDLALAAMEARIESLEVQLSSKDRQIEAREREVGELHRLLAQTALNAAPARPWWKIW